MSIRETVISAALINTALLFILFLTAVGQDNTSIAHASSLDSVMLSSPREDFYTNPKMNHDHFEHAQLPIEHRHQNEVCKEMQDQNAVHVVEVGERLELIAAKYHTTVEQLVWLNELSSTQLVVGQKIRVPAGQEKKQETAAFQPALEKTPSKKESNSSQKEAQVQQESAHKYHYVQKGESPWSISRKYNISLQRLLDLNRLDEQSARRLREGDRLRVQ